jgi:hypothetical protein
MKSFTRSSVDEHLTFCWSLFFLLLLINNIIGLALALAVNWKIKRKIKIKINKQKGNKKKK